MSAREWPKKRTEGPDASLASLVDDLRMAENVSALQAEHIEYLSNDPLTGLKNRGAFDSVLDQTVKLVKRGNMKASLIAIDIDHFKIVNDSLGHGAGDAVLREIGALLKRSVREIDTVGRVGGEEIMILLSGADESFATKKADELRGRIEELTWKNYPNLKVTASFGVAALSVMHSVEEIKDFADNALYEAKKSGRNRVEVYTSQHEPLRRTI